MNNKFFDILPLIIRNSRFNFSLSGWPAAITVVAFCVTAGYTYTIKRIYDNKTALDDSPQEWTPYVA